MGPVVNLLQQAVSVQALARNCNNKAPASPFSMHPSKPPDETNCSGKAMAAAQI